jgi:hypothetical protein
MAYRVTCADCRLEFKVLPEEEAPWLGCPGCGARVLNPAPTPVRLPWEFPRVVSVGLVLLVAGTLACSYAHLLFGLPLGRLLTFGLAGFLFLAGPALIRAGQEETPQVVGDYLRGTALTGSGVVLLIASLTLVGGLDLGLVLAVVLGGLVLLRVGRQGLTLILPPRWVSVATAALVTLLAASWLVLALAFFAVH